MKTISLISVYNNKTLVDEMIKTAISQTGVEVDFVMVDNRQRQFNSAAEALNYGAEKAKGEVFVFLHQDIEFLSDNVLESIYDFAIQNPNSVFGAAGKDSSNLHFIYSDMHAGPNKSKYTTCDKPTKAFTLDECLIACNKACFGKIKFNSSICDGWHLYGAELCLQAQTFANMEVFVIPLDIWHKSNGNADKSYFKCQNKLGKCYKNYYKVVNTTNGYVYTNFFKRLVQNLYRTLRYGSLK